MEKNLLQIRSSFKQKFAQYLHYFKAKYRNEKLSEINLLKRFIPSGAVIFDIGAEFGQYSKIFANIHNKSCTVYCFEPVDYTREVLIKVLKKYHNTSIFSNAFLDTDGKTFINIPLKKSGKLGPGLATIGKQTDRNFVKQAIEAKTLDNFLLEQKINNLNFIKIDVEGAELLVFKGGINSIKKFKPVIKSEVDSTLLNRVGVTVDQLFDFFNNLNYEFYIVENNSLIKVLNYKYPTDYLFIPKDFDKSSLSI